jgi:tetratricopeptide (TPR) repeat protein
VNGDAVAYLEQSVAALAAFERAGDLRTACSARIDVGSAYLQLGAYEESEAALRAALKDAGAMGLIPIRAVLEAHLGLCLAFEDVFPEAHALLEKSVATFRAQKSRRAEGATGTYLAIMLQRAGDLEAAERAVREALEVLTTAPLLRPQALGVLASILLGRGDHAAALTAAREAHEAIAELGHVEEGEALVNLVLAEALAACGRTDEAVRAIEAAQTQLIARGEKIASDVWRKSFLERVPEHARTLALAQSMRGTSTPAP